MYTYKKEEVNGEEMWVVQETDWRKVRDTLLDSMTNFGIPMIYVEDADYNRHGELLLRHAYDGKPLDRDYTARTLKYLSILWKRPVHLQTEARGPDHSAHPRRRRVRRDYAVVCLLYAASHALTTRRGKRWFKPSP